MPYGFIEVPYDLTKEEDKQKNTPKEVEEKKSLKDKLSDAYNKASKSVKEAIENPTQTIKKLSNYMNGDTMKKIGGTLSNTFTTATTKYSGIALAQMLVDGKVTSKSALDYLCLGAAPALNQTGIAMGYTGLTQIKNALSNGTINVGQFISGLSKTVEGIYEIAKVDNTKEKATKNNRIYFDMTLSDTSDYQSETPDRRVENGNDLTEFCHNLPATYSVQCELQDNKRYSKEEFRGLLEQLREKKVPVTLYLGDEHFNSLVLQGFSPNGQGSQKAGFEYSLNFKRIVVGSIEEVVLQSFANAPSSSISNSGNSGSSGSSGSSGRSNSRGSSGVTNTNNAKKGSQKQDKPKNISALAKTKAGQYIINNGKVQAQVGQIKGYITNY